MLLPACWYRMVWSSLKRSNATVVAPETVDKLFSVDASGKLKEIDLNAFVIKKSIRRLSWRELF